ncbi:uncharacterized protein LODBEIA_P32140 [Lodderomyces beijingensis]|uniref:Uncharacterized protein n=1 Tax=Lodderomyces beijingensis TaxID=1775926 RepID=A0ABP0ZP41_9ASCO
MFRSQSISNINEKKPAATKFFNAFRRKELKNRFSLSDLRVSQDNTPQKLAPSSTNSLNHHSAETDRAGSKLSRSLKRLSLINASPLTDELFDNTSIDIESVSSYDSNKENYTCAPSHVHAESASHLPPPSLSKTASPVTTSTSAFASQSPSQATPTSTATTTTTMANNNNRKRIHRTTNVKDLHEFISQISSEHGETKPPVSSQKSVEWEYQEMEKLNDLLSNSATTNQLEPLTTEITMIESMVFLKTHWMSRPRSNDDAADARLKLFVPELGNINYSHALKVEQYHWDEEEDDGEDHDLRLVY